MGASSLVVAVLVSAERRLMLDGGAPQQDTVFVSLGHRCEVAWQLREFSGQEQAYPFDWLVTPLQAIPMMVEEDFAAIADPKYLRVTEYGGGIGWSVENMRYKVLLHHEFKRAPDGRIVDDWRGSIEQVAAKFAYLRRRWIDLMESARQICFVRRLGCLEMPSERHMPTFAAHYEALFSAFGKRAPQASRFYMFCDCDEVPVSDTVFDVSIGNATALDWRLDEDRWKGRSVAYRNALEQILRPALSKTATTRQRRHFAG
jgi:hypothetical protein